MKLAKLKPHGYNIGIAAGYTAILAANVSNPSMLLATLAGGVMGGVAAVGYVLYYSRAKSKSSNKAETKAGSLETKLAEEKPAELSQTLGDISPAIEKPKTEEIYSPQETYKAEETRTEMPKLVIPKLKDA